MSDISQHMAASAANMRRSRQRWRFIAFIALLIALLALALRFGGSTGDDTPHIARLVINDVITTDAQRRRIIADLAENSNVKAVIVAINSPGGTTAGGEELYDGIIKLGEDKPVIATIDELGASAAYMTAIASNRIYARRLSIVGSIGVLMQHVNAGRLLDTIGIEFDKIQTGPLKAEPDINDPLTGATRASLQALVDDSFDWFVDIVAERRGLSRPTTLALADGRILTGRMALEAGLIDAIGGEAEAVQWLEADANLAEDLPIYTVYPLPVSEFDQFTRYLGGQVGNALGFGRGNAMALDGLVSLWQAGEAR